MDFRFEHEYFKAQASLWLGAVLYALEVLGKTVTFSVLRELLSNKEKLRELQKSINKLKKAPSQRKVKVRPWFCLSNKVFRLGRGFLSGILY